MARAPQVVSTVPLDIPRESLERAGQTYGALAQAGGAIADWGARELALQQTREVEEKSTLAALEMDKAYLEELAKPGHEDLDLRVKGRLEEIHKTYGSSIKNRRVRMGFDRAFNSLTLDKMIRARVEQRSREIGASAATYDESGIRLQELARNASGDQLDAIHAEMQGITDAAVMNQIISPEEGVQRMHQWNRGVQRDQVLMEFRKDLPGDNTRLLSALEGLRGDGFAGLDPLDREELIQAGEAEVDRRLRAERQTWQDDPETYTRISNDIHSGHTPTVTAANILAEYYPGQKLKEETARILINELEAVKTQRAGGDANKPAGLSQRHAQAEQMLRRTLGEEGPLAILGQIDQTSRQVAADALDQLTRRSAYFDGTEDPIAAWRQIRETYLPMMLEAGQGRIDTRRKFYRAGTPTATDPLGFAPVLQRMGITPQKIASGQITQDQQDALEEMKQLQDAQDAINQSRATETP